MVVTDQPTPYPTHHLQLGISPHSATSEFVQMRTETLVSMWSVGCENLIFRPFTNVRATDAEGAHVKRQGARDVRVIYRRIIKWYKNRRTQNGHDRAAGTTAPRRSCGFIT